LTKSLYEKRHKTVSQIPNFWPLVIEQAPPDIDEYIQPSDSALLLSSLTSLSVSHFEIEDGSNGDPRSVAIRWEFAPNDYFDDTILEKKFWYRYSKAGWSGLVSEPVDIHWKKGKDLTSGLLGMVKQVWDEEQASGGLDKPKTTPTPEQKALRKKIENTGLGGLSFFAWFGYRGKRISAEESREAVEKDRARRRLIMEGKEPDEAANIGPAAEDEEDEEDDDEDDDADSLEIFPDGADLAITITEDLWPGAIKYFSKFMDAFSERTIPLNAARCD
jgi:hypothetical protein